MSIFSDDLEAKGVLPSPEEDEDAPPAFLKKGAKKKSIFAADLEAKGFGDDAPAASESRPFKNTGPDLAGQTKADLDAFAAERAPEHPTILQRAKKTAGDLAETFMGGAKAVGTGAVHPIDTITSGPRRRQFERGVDDMVTLGYGQKLAARVGNSSFGGLRTPDTADVAIGPETFGGGVTGSGGEPVANTQAKDQEVAPEFRQLGHLVGAASPGATSGLAKAGMKGAQALLPAVAGAKGLTAAALEAGRGVAGYEMSVPAMAGLSAGAEGNRAGAALDAATDPVGLGLSGGIPAAVEGASGALRSERALAARARLIKSSRERAVKDMGSEITSAEGPRATTTAQKRISEVNDRLFELTKENPELHKVWSMPAKEALPKLQKTMREKIEPRNGLYEEMDAATVGATPAANGDISGVGGGIRLGDVVDGYRRAAEDAVNPSKGGGTFGEADARRLSARADQFVRVYGAEGPPKFNPGAVITDDGMTAGEMLKILERRPSAPGAQAEIARIREQATVPGGVDMDARIPTIQFRKEVTESGKAAEAALGGLQGGPLYEALDNLHRVGGEILNKHIDESGLPQKKIDQLRKINDEYFLLKRAETAIESRGWKENNRPGFHLPHGVKAAVEGGGLAGMAGYAIMHPHAIPAMAATYGAVKAAPRVARAVNWKLANLPEVPAAAPTANSAAVARLIQAGRAPGVSRAQLHAQAEKDGVPVEIADNIAASQGL